MARKKSHVTRPLPSDGGDVPVTPPRITSDTFAALRRDPTLVDAGTEGERLVAGVRILLLCLLLLTQLVPSVNPIDNLIGVTLNLVALVVALVIYALATYRFRPWLSFVSSGLDVSLVSLGLAAFLAFGQAQTAVNSKVVFEVYFLALGCASLRYDWRVCAMAGALAVVQYASIVSFAWSHFEFGGAIGAETAFGWNVQLGRLIVLTAASFLSVAGVLRAQRLRLLSTTDRLTSLANRGSFDLRLSEEESRARRYNREFAVALVDVDHFKRFNDSHGHAAGDLALQALAETLRGSVRRSDLVARYGGEEFALILPETGLEEAATKVELMRRLVVATEIELDPTLVARIDVSAGVASFPRDGSDARTVLAVADARLYEAKRSGRGRVVCGTPRFRT